MGNNSDRTRHLTKSAGRTMTHDQMMDIFHTDMQPLCDCIESLCDIDAVAAQRSELARIVIEELGRIVLRDFARMIEQAEANHDTALVLYLQKCLPEYRQKLFWASSRCLETIKEWQREQNTIRRNMREFFGPNSPHRDPKHGAKHPGLMQRQLVFVRQKWIDPVKFLDEALDELRFT